MNIQEARVIANRQNTSAHVLRANLQKQIIGTAQTAGCPAGETNNQCGPPFIVESPKPTNLPPNTQKQLGEITKT